MIDTHTTAAKSYSMIAINLIHQWKSIISTAMTNEG